MSEKDIRSEALRIRRQLAGLERLLLMEGRRDLAPHADSAWNLVQEITNSLDRD